MPTKSSFDYAIVRVVPRVEREEFINAGVILFCRTRRFLDARIDLDEKRLLALAPDIDIAGVRAHLDLIPCICEGGQGSIGRVDQAERFHWLITPRSTVIQISPVHTGLCTDPAEALEHLLETMVRVNKSTRGDVGS
jgi:hypothetical protein